MCSVWHGSPETPEHYENRLLWTECVCIPILNKHEQWHFHSTHISVHENIDRISGELGGVTRARRGPAPARGGAWAGGGRSLRKLPRPAALSAMEWTGGGAGPRRRREPRGGLATGLGTAVLCSRGLEGRMRCELKGPMGWAGPAPVGLREQAVDWDEGLAGCAFWPVFHCFSPRIMELEPSQGIFKIFIFLFIRIFTKIK